MTMRLLKNIGKVVVLVFISGCIEPFDAPVRNDEVDFLVVEAFVNTSSHVATVKLSRAVPLGTVSEYPFISNAVVTIEDEVGQVNSLPFVGDGTYALKSDNFQTEKQFRLRIKTDGNEYESVLMKARHTPPIDSLTWDVTEDGINIRVTTHDAEHDTRYYRWDVVETWEYHSAYSSNFEFINGVPELRKFEERINVCYKTETSPALNTGNTLEVTENKIVKRSLLFLEKFSPKIEYTYSAEVLQYALSKDGYDYWEKLRTTSSSLGGLFDPQPARIKGNITNVRNANEAVIGYFDAGEMASTRIIIRNRQLPQAFQRYPQDGSCEEYFADPQETLRLNGAQLLTSAVYEGIVLLGYKYTTFECADCRVKGGLLQKPAYWPN